MPKRRDAQLHEVLSSEGQQDRLVDIVLLEQRLIFPEAEALHHNVHDNGAASAAGRAPRIGARMALG